MEVEDGLLLLGSPDLDSTASVRDAVDIDPFVRIEISVSEGQALNVAEYLLLDLSKRVLALDSLPSRKTDKGQKEARQHFAVPNETIGESLFFSRF